MTRHDINSQWIDGPRRVTVIQGAGTTVDGPGTRRPGPHLLILHDGQNLFEPDRAHRPGHHWQVVETLERLTAAGKLPPLVIAGIDHGEDNRLVELTPTEDGHVGAGLSWRYGRFVLEELVPFLAAEYGVDVTPGSLGVGGSSLGGLATLALAQQYPGRFGRLLAMSPSLWWDRRVILRRLRRHPLPPSTRVWLDCGHLEGRDTLTNVRHLRRLLRDQLDAGLVGGAEDPEGDHSEDSWARRFPDALQWLYAGVSL